jgi:hypothetical protein
MNECIESKYFPKIFVFLSVLQIFYQFFFVQFSPLKQVSEIFGEFAMKIGRIDIFELFDICETWVTFLISRKPKFSRQTFNKK